MWAIGGAGQRPRGHREHVVRIALGQHGVDNRTPHALAGMRAFELAFAHAQRRDIAADAAGAPPASARIVHRQSRNEKTVRLRQSLPLSHVSTSSTGSLAENGI